MNCDTRPKIYSSNCATLCYAYYSAYRDVTSDVAGHVYLCKWGKLSGPCIVMVSVFGATRGHKTMPDWASIKKRDTPSELREKYSSIRVARGEELHLKVGENWRLIKPVKCPMIIEIG